MQIRIACPAPRGARHGSRISAERWESVLRELGHNVIVQCGYAGEPCDLLIALHAKGSAPAVREFARQRPGRPVVLVLTGTDVYRAIRRYPSAQAAVRQATRLVALQPLAQRELAPDMRGKVRVIYQSAPRTSEAVRSPDSSFQVCVVGHLRAVKDPFRTAMAVRGLPAASRICVVHAGSALSESFARRARSEEQRNPRYRWLGDLPRARVRRLIASSHLLVLSSRMEGGANVISEAIVDGTPVLASRIAGSIGLLGVDYPGYFPFGDTAALRRLLLRAESDAAFYRQLRFCCRRIEPIFRRPREMAAWRSLLGELKSCGAIESR